MCLTEELSKVSRKRSSPRPRSSRTLMFLTPCCLLSQVYRSPANPKSENLHSSIMSVKPSIIQSSLSLPPYCSDKQSTSLKSPAHNHGLSNSLLKNFRSSQLRLRLARTDFHHKNQ